MSRTDRNRRRELRLEVSAPPSANLLYNVHAGKWFKRTEYVQWLEVGRADVWEAVRGEGRAPPDGIPDGWPERGGFIYPKGRPLGAELVMPFSRKRDIDNGIKALLDLMQRMCVIEDDRWVDFICVSRNAELEHARVCIWEMEGGDQ